MSNYKLGLTILFMTICQWSVGQVIDFTSISQTVSESDGTATITVQFDVAAAVDITIPFTLTGDAVEGVAEDYTITATPLSILAGATSGDIVVTINDDLVTEADETIIVTLETPSAGTLGTDIVHTVTLTDNDTPPTVTIIAPADASSFVEGSTIDFEATANDVEDGDLTDNINWNSDLDGDFDVGGTSSISTLSIGTHIITASVTDASAITTEATITVTITNEAPIASDVLVTGTLEVGQLLTGSYTYSDTEGDLEGISTFRWLRDGIEIVGATGTTYLLTVDDDGANISFEVTPIALSGTLTGTAVESPEVGPVLPANTAPTATDVLVTGTLEVGEILTGSYTYSDADGDLEGTSTFRWLRDGVEIVGATSTTYILTIDDDGANISFEVTPLALTGQLTGIAVESPEVGPILPANTAPTVTNVLVTGTLEVGEILTGSYTYSDADGDLEGTSTFRWLRDGAEIVGATGSTYLLIVDDDGANISFEVTPVAFTGVFTGTAVESPEVGPILPANTAPIAEDVLITGGIEVGDLLTGTYTYSDADGDLEGLTTFRWLSDGLAISGATASTYTLTAADEGALITFEVTPVALSGVLVGLAVLSPEIGPIIAANTGPVASNVAITGTTEVGQLLTGSYDYSDSDGDLEGLTTFRWLRDGVEISGATNLTYTLVIDDQDALISFEVTPVALSGVLVGAAVESSAVGPIGAANSVPTASGVEISGTLEVGQQLTGNYIYSDLDGDIEGATSFRWLRDGIEISGATSSTYTLVDSDEGADIIFEVTPVAISGASPGGAVQSAAAGPILAANDPPVAESLSISGDLEVGMTITGNYTFTDVDGDLEGTSTYRWLRDGLAIASATAQTYVLQADDEGSNISFEVVPVALTGDSPGSPAQSPAVGPILPANTAPSASGVSITGTTEVGFTLIGSYTYSDADGDLEGTSIFRWLRNGEEIVGAISTAYILQPEDEGTTLVFEVTPVALTGVSPGDPAISAAVGPIGAANTIPTASDVSITGAAEVGQILTGSYTYNDADADAEGASTFKWLRDGVDIPSAVGLNYTISAVDLGSLISFEVTPIALTGANPGSPVQSASIGPVVPANSAPIVSNVGISGLLVVGEQLNGLYTFIDADGDPEGATTFRWLRDGVEIEGANLQSYRLVEEDQGSNVIFEVTPAAASGASPGRPVQSASIGPIRAADQRPIDINPLLLPPMHVRGSGVETYRVEITGDIEIARVLFIFKSLTANNTSWVTRDLISDDRVFEISVTEEVFDEMGFTYEFIVSGTDGSSVNLLGVTYVEYPEEGLNFESLVFGNEVTDYNLVSIPLDLNDASINGTFGDDLGEYDQSQWRFFGYQPGQLTENAQGLNVVERGQGYWMIVKNLTDLDTGIGNTALEADQEFQLELEPGWNLIGNPYTFNISWRGVLASNPGVSGVDNQLTTFLGGYRTEDVLDVFQGAFVFAEQQLSLTVPLLQDESIQGRSHQQAQEPLLDGEWEMKLTAQGAIWQTDLSGFGMRFEALEEKDRFDRVRPPRFIEYLDISFNETEVLDHPMTKDIAPVKQNHTWSFVVDSNTEDEQIVLSWEQLGGMISDNKLMMHHLESGRIVDMTQAQQYAFSAGTSNTFMIAYGTDEFVDEQLIPQQVSLTATYPNPFREKLNVEYTITDDNSSRVELLVFDAKGRLVRRLGRGSASQGFYNVSWDGTSDSGVELPAGLYLIRLVVGGQKEIFKRVVKY